MKPMISLLYFLGVIMGALGLLLTFASERGGPFCAIGRALLRALGKDKPTGKTTLVGMLLLLGGTALIVTPTFAEIRKKSHANECVNNLYRIYTTKDDCAIENALGPGDPVPPELLSQYIPGGIDSLKCPDGGRYTINPIGTVDECSFHGKFLPPWED